MTLGEAFDCVRDAYFRGRLANGYLIVAPPRAEGTELAIKIMQLLFCESEHPPCGECIRCRHVHDRTEPDIHWVFPEKKSRVISVDQIRDTIVSQMSQTSFGGGWKVGVITGADRLNTAAANAFLKTLEEPTEKTLFLLLSDLPQELLPTIVSRCQRINLNAPQTPAEPWHSRLLEIISGPYFRTPGERMASAGLISSVLGEIKIQAEQTVKGELREQEKLIEESKNVIEARVESLYREHRQVLPVTLTQWFRDLLVLRSSGDDSLINYRSHLEILRERAQRLTLAQALDNMIRLEEFTAKLKLNVPEESVVSYTIDVLNHGVAT